MPNAIIIRHENINLGAILRGHIQISQITEDSYNDEEEQENLIKVGYRQCFLKLYQI